MTYPAFVLARLAVFAAEQGLRYGAQHNALAAAEVIANRVRAGWHGGEWLRVIDGAREVEGTRLEPVAVNPRDAGFQAMLRGIDDVYYLRQTETYTVLTDLEGHERAALYFADLNDTTPWFRWHILRNRDLHPILATVGPITFFG